MPELRSLNLKSIAFWTLALISAGIATLFMRSSPFADLNDYIHAASYVHDGANPYSTLYDVPFGNESLTLSYFYPPFLVTLLSFFVKIPFTTLSSAWTFLSVLAVFYSVRLLSTLPSTPWRPWLLYMGCLSAVFFPPVIEGFYFGQVHAFVLLALSGFAKDIVRKKDVSAGIWLGLAALLKMSPIILGILFLIRRSTKGILSLAGTLICGLLICAASNRGIILLGDFLSALPNILGSEFFWDMPENYSVSHLIAGLTEISRTSARLAASILMLVLLSGTILMSIKKNSRTISTHLVAALCALMVLSSPIIWFHHLTWILVPVLLELCSNGKKLQKALIISAALVLAFSLPMNVYAHTVIWKNSDPVRRISGLLLVLTPLMMIYAVAAQGILYPAKYQTN